MTDASCLYRKLAALVPLSSEEDRALRALPIETTAVPRRRDILVLRERPSYLYVVLAGWTARYGLRVDGTRRITGFMMPGDFCGIHSVADAAMDHAIVALTSCTIGRIDRRHVEDIVAAYPIINKALWRAKLIDEAILRKWLLNSADAYQAIGHLLCELHERASLIGLVADGWCKVPLTQEEIGNAVGITSVHTNRTMKRLREDGLVELAHGELLIRDIVALRRAAHFEPTYLQPWQRDQFDRN